jgi:hypothetical protein
LRFDGLWSGDHVVRNLGIAALGALRVVSVGYCATYVSPVVYQSYTCQQLALEAQAVSTRAAALSGAQDSQHTKDGVAAAAAIVIFWPAAFFVGRGQADGSRTVPNEGTDDRG